ncbi:DUF6265 family protein [Pontixanthobacter sp. CEM42]|uniref:DUF6265 family protein n=1 Tax=Pontixanthobacter sp. CEM42 TaxID=2792077 RepID=UPI001AE09C68|nr:DUF6265 family protein [Pontixanthobacter sp. CEM42]
MTNFGWKSIVAAIMLLCGAAASAQETRTAPKDQPSPPATLADVDWLIGQWSGTGIGGNPAHESWLPPVGTTMVGTFIQEDGESGIQFSEHMYLMEENGSLVMRLKHFNADLTAWEDKEGMVTFRLIEIEPCAAYFRGLTLRCTMEEESAGGLVAAVKMQSGEELLFNFDRTGAQQASSGCDGTTYAINQCLAAVRDRAITREEQYFEAAIAGKTGLSARMTERERLMRAAQSLAKEYRKEACAAVYEQWKEGTIRNAMMLRCEIRLIDQRTHDIWRNWLTFQDTTAPILPEPGSTR